jgi:hypothetical protein
MNHAVARLTRQYGALRWNKTNPASLAARKAWEDENRSILASLTHRQRGHRVQLLRKRLAELRLLLKGQS